METQAKIIEITKDGKKQYRILSKTGKNLGTFLTRKAAEKRLTEVEMFKHMKK